MSSVQKSRRGIILKTVQWAIAVLFLTSIHHAYGAYLYETPWRLHMVYVSGATILVMVAALALLGRSSTILQTLGSILLGITVLVLPVLAIGAFEGAYNHVLKNLLYFGGASPTLMLTLFPPPTYEMPNDVLFELTGILQVVSAAFTAGYLYWMMMGHRTKAPDSRTGPVPLKSAVGQTSRLSWNESQQGRLRHPQ